MKSIEIRGKNAREMSEEENMLIPRQSPLLFLHSWTDNDLEIVSNADYSNFNEAYVDSFVCVLNICRTRKRSVFVRFLSWPGTDNVQSIIKTQRKINCDITCDLSVLLRESLPSLHTLVLKGCKSCKLGQIAQANVKNKLPNLSILNLSGTYVNGYLHLLLCGTFPSLTSLILSRCVLLKEDLVSLAEAGKKG